MYKGKRAIEKKEKNIARKKKKKEGKEILIWKEVIKINNHEITKERRSTKKNDENLKSKKKKRIKKGKKEI